MRIATLLPYKENFSNNNTGAVSISVNDTNQLSKFRNSIKVYGSTTHKSIYKNYVNVKLNKKFLQSTSKIYVNNLRRNYKILINSNGYVVTSNVELNGATMEKLSNIKDENDANAMYERRIGISQEELDKIKEYFTSLMPEIEFLYNKKEGSVIIKLPVIVSTKTIENNER